MGVPMIDELLGDSFLKKLFKDFFELLEDNVIPIHPMLQVKSPTIHEKALFVLLADVE